MLSPETTIGSDDKPGHVYVSWDETRRKVEKQLITANSDITCWWSSSFDVDDGANDDVDLGPLLKKNIMIVTGIQPSFKLSLVL